MKSEQLEMAHKVVKAGIYALVSSYTGAGMFYLSNNLRLGLIMSALTAMLFITLVMEDEIQ